MYSIFFMILALAIFSKVMSILVTHLFFRDQFDWFKNKQLEKGKPTGYGIFLIKYLSLFSPATLWHAQTLPDISQRAFKSVSIVVGLFVVLMYFLPIGG